MERTKHKIREIIQGLLDQGYSRTELQITTSLKIMDEIWTNPQKTPEGLKFEGIDIIIDENCIGVYVQIKYNGVKMKEITETHPSLCEALNQEIGVITKYCISKEDIQEHTVDKQKIKEAMVKAETFQEKICLHPLTKVDRLRLEGINYAFSILKEELELE